MTNRKYVPDYKKKKECINILTTTIQKKEIEKKAKAEEVSVSEYIRNILFPN